MEAPLQIHTMAAPFRAPSKKYPSEDIYLTINFHHAFEVKRQYEKEAPQLWNTLGRRHRMMLYKRFIAMSSRASGDWGWPPLSSETLERKARNKARYPSMFPGNPSWIMRATSIMLRTIDFIPKKDGYFVGFVRDRAYPKYPSESRRESRKVYSAYTVLQLAWIHHKGEGRVPRRPLIVRPDRKTYRVLVAMANQQFGKIIRKANADT